MKLAKVLSLAYIDKLLEDPDIEIIEVWSRVLYARMKKGCGKRNKFISKRNLEYGYEVYFREQEFKSVSKTYHPDLAEKSKRSSSEKLQKNINCFHDECTAGLRERSKNAISYIYSLSEFTQLTSTESSAKRASLRDKIYEQVDSARLNYGPGFFGDSDYGVWTELVETSDDSEKKIYEEFAKQWAWAMSDDVQWEVSKNYGWTDRKEWDAFREESKQAMEDAGW